jgi:glycosyltransferase involved in cell wall biosynthesis
MSSGPLVSVIIPTWNRAALVVEAAASVLAQDYPRLELLVVDDGSTDDTRERLAAIGDDRLRLLVNEENLGVSAARNRGIRAAAGEFIALLDSDDLWRPAKLSRQLEFFRHRPAAQICQTGEVWIRNGVRVNPRRRHRKYSGDIFRHCLPLCIVSPSAVMLRRSLLTAVGLFDESLPACEDYDLWLRIAARHPIYLLDEPLVVKRGGHADQLSRTVPRLDYYRLRSLMKLLRETPLTAEQRQLAVAELRRKAAIYLPGCRKRGRLAEAVALAAELRAFGG